MLQENKAREIFSKNEYFLPHDIHKWVCVKTFVFQKIWRALFFCNTRFEIRPFTLPTNRQTLSTNIYVYVLLMYEKHAIC